MLKNRLNFRNVATIVACFAAKNVAMIKKKSIVVIGMICIILSACSSPEKDGIKAAKRMYQCGTDYTQKRIAIVGEQNKAYELYIRNFNSYSFETRVDAREKLNEYLEKSRQSFERLEENYRECQRKASEFRSKLREKYSTNQERLNKFYFAYNNYQPTRRDAPQEVHVDYSSRIRDLIITIIPPKPCVVRMKNDLIGRVIANQTTGYANWTITHDDLNALEAINMSDNGKEILFDAQFRLQRINQWDASINVRYVLSDHEDWWSLLNFSSQMNIVRTNNYDNCIKTQMISPRTLGIPHRHVEFTNSCDVGLIVFGEFTRSSPSIGRSLSRDFNIQVPANGKTLLDHQAINSNQILFVSSFTIHFVERAGL
jgi:exonuclease VII small subunit